MKNFLIFSIAILSIFFSITSTKTAEASTTNWPSIFDTIPAISENCATFFKISATQHGGGSAPTDYTDAGRNQENLILLGYDFGVPNYKVSFINIIGFLLYLASNIIGLAGFLAVIYIMIGGITLVLSGGNEEQAQKGKKTLTYAIGGFILAVAAFVIVNTFLRYIVGIDISEIPTEPT